MKHSITNALIIISFLAMIIGCYSENKALKQVARAHIKYPSSIAGYCSLAYPSIDASIDSVAYIPGNPVTINDTIYIHDTASERLIKYIKQYRTRIDTIYRLKSIQLVNRAKETYLTESNMKTSMELVKLQKERQILHWVAAILGIYTLVRWIVRFWGVRLP
jgi:hypothetical protein